MAETEFGPGGYACTPAATPSEPVASDITSETAVLTIGEDPNPSHTVYALFNATAEFYVDVDGGVSAIAVWHTRETWGAITVTGLDQVTSYQFKAKARNQEGVETEYGPPTEFTTYNMASVSIGFELEVQKASSTISAPSFMSGLDTSIRLAGKSLNDFGFHVERISGLDVPCVVPDEEFVPGSHTWQVHDEYFSPKRIVMEGHVHGTSPENLRLRLAYLKSFLATFDGNPWRSIAPVTLDRADLPDRHWIVYYESIDEVETLGKRDLSSSTRFRVTMKCPTPYALSNEVVRISYAASADTFRVIDLGNAPSDVVFVVKGESENPSFTVGDMMFHCDFSDGLGFTDVENTSHEGTYTPSDNEAGACTTTETGTGILVIGSDTVSYTAKGNTADGSWIVIVAPEWQSSDQATDVVLLEHRANADNYVRLYWDGSEQAWTFRKRAGGVDHEVATAVQAFTTGTRLILGITYDATNAGGMKIFVNGAQANVDGDTTALETAPGALTLHSGEGDMQPNAVFDMIAGWSRMLSADEMLKIASNPTAVRNLNASVSYTGTLDENDLLVLDSRQKTARLFDVSAGIWSNVLHNVTGSIPSLIPGRRKTATDRTQTVIYTGNEANLIEMRYRRHYL